MNDADPEIKRKLFDMIMARSGEERFMMGVRSFDAAREIVLASLPKDLPHDELNRRLFERIYGASIEEIVKQTRNGEELRSGFRIISRSSPTSKQNVNSAES